MPDTSFHRRFAADRLIEALEDSPAVLIHGPRQSGKTTLAQRVGARAGYAYFSFDDEAIRGAATTDPVGLRELEDAAGRRFACGVVLYDGTTSLSFGESFSAVPIRALWEAP